MNEGALRQGGLLRRQAPLAVILGCGLVALLIGQGAFGAFPHSADEYVYLYQARTLLEGRVANPPLPDPSLGFVHVVSNPTGTYGKYPPGWPAILASGELLGVPFAINALLIMLTLWIAFRLCEAVTERRTALVGILLLGTSPFVLLSGASLYSHPLAGLLLLGLLACLWRYAQEHRVPWLLAAAGCLGGIGLTRPFDAALVSLALSPLALEFLWRRRLQALGHGAAAGAVLAGVLGILLLYNQGTTGDPWTPGHYRYATGDAPSLLAYRFFLPSLRRLREYSLFAFPVLLFPLAVGVLWRQLPRRVLATSLLVILAIWVGYVAYPVSPPPRLGPRYVYGAHLLLTLLLAAGLCRAVQRPWLGALVSIVVAGQLFVTGAIALELRHLLYQGTAVYRVADALEGVLGQRKALVVLAGPSGTIPPQDLVRNDLDLEAPILFARQIERGARPWERTRAAGRSVYFWDGAGGPPVLWTADPGAPVQQMIAVSPRPWAIRRGVEPGWIAVFSGNECAPAPYLGLLWNASFPPDRISDVQRFSDGSRGPCPGLAAAHHLEEVGIPENLPRRLAIAGVLRSFLTVREPGRYAFVLEGHEHAALRVGGVTIAESREGVPSNAFLELEAGAHPLAVTHHTRWREPRLELQVWREDGAPVEITTQVPDGVRFRPRLPEDALRPGVERGTP
ncbi:MAG: hypothetical protein ABFS46_04825 [Myxococcota bacterium]